MRTIASALLTHIAQEVTTLAMCWRITRKDGIEFFFTDHDVDLTVDGDVYQAETGLSHTAIEFKITAAVDNSEVIGFFNSGEITEDDLIAGLFDDAEIRMFVVNWADPTIGTIKAMRGWIGVVTRQDQAFTAEVRSLTQLLQTNVGTLFTGRCRSDFGDTGSGPAGGCNFDVGSVTQSGTVATVTDRRQFSMSGVSPPPDNTGGTKNGGFFELGTVTFTNGANAGLTREIEDQSGNDIVLFEPFPFDIQVGDAFDVAPGCDKTKGVCRDNWDNLVNFRGEPYIPGPDFMFKIDRASGGGKK